MTISQYMTNSHKARNPKASPTKARRERESLERRDAILAAARNVFFENGIHRATVDDVAAHAEVAKGTVYLYFESKETLLAHLLLEGLDALGEQLAEAFAENHPFTAEQRLRRLASAYLDFFENEPDYFRLMMALDRGQFQEAISTELHQQIMTRSINGLGWVVRAIDQGVTDSDFAVADSKSAAGVFWAAINGALVLMSHPIRREMLQQSVESLYTGVMELMLKGMKK
ncbi:MAG: TetR/AcrR family transcriptional regulator [Chloroflexi bacterium]|nr:TetR/AcrR family transcriptional regulator [Chloroflexota bacterium]